MANKSILAAFERMWQHIVSALNKKISYESQNLTEEQRAQARDNIGVNTLIVTMDADDVSQSGLATHSSLDVHNHVRNGGTALFMYNGHIYTFDGAFDDAEYAQAYFVCYVGEESLLKNICLYEDKTTDMFDSFLVDNYMADNNYVKFTYPQELDEQQKAQARKNIGSDTLVVTINDDLTLSHTFDDIYTHHVQNGSSVVLYDYQIGDFYNLAGSSEQGEYIQFMHYRGQDVIYAYTIFSDNTVEYTENRLLHDDTPVVRYSEQSLTDEQKAQVRENIGVAQIQIITWEDDD